MEILQEVAFHISCIMVQFGQKKTEENLNECEKKTFRGVKWLRIPKRLSATYYMSQHFSVPLARLCGRRKKTFTYPDILVEHFNDDGGRIDSNFIHVSPQNQILEDQHLIPGRTPGLPDHTGVGNKVCEDYTTKGICDQNKAMP